MDYSNKTLQELIALCKEKKIQGYSGKKKKDILELLNPATALIVEPTNGKICRLNYIGSKYQLLDWITSTIQEKTGWTSFQGKTIADLFAGTGIVSYHFRQLGAKVLSNDAELYSSIITHAFTRSIFTPQCKVLLDSFQKEIDENKHKDTIGFITKHYSPHECERKFFTVETAKKLDYLRKKLEDVKSTLTEDEYKFLLASLLLSADAVSNVPAVYGCFLKNFKAKALKSLQLTPIHTITTPSVPGSSTTNRNVLETEFLNSFTADIVYLDPPYNERQYSKNYFPLNILAKTPEQLLVQDELKGKTGIPQDCFISPFCKKGTTVENAFEALFKNLKAKWIFLSYNSESLITQQKMLELMNKYGKGSVVERDYKRFKSFEYNKDVSIKEYLFCLEKAV